MSKLIYDIGANKGDNLDYYLKKADKVVAVEANPVLAKRLVEKFGDAIDSGRLVIENCVLVGGKHSGDVNFFVHKKLDVLSTFATPAKKDRGHFKELVLPSLHVDELMRRHGHPYFVKIDIEGYDHVIVEELFKLEIFPDYLSVELMHPRAFPLLVALGGYKAFKITEGAAVGNLLRNRKIEVDGKAESHTFRFHSAGPFGPDLKGKWRRPGFMQRVIGVRGCGWRDIHVSRVDKPVSKRFWLLPEIVRHLSMYLLCAPRFIWEFARYLCGGYTKK